MSLVMVMVMVMVLLDPGSWCNSCLPCCVHYRPTPMTEVDNYIATVALLCPWTSRQAKDFRHAGLLHEIYNVSLAHRVSIDRLD